MDQITIRNAALLAEIDALRTARAQQAERIAQWMIANSFATGHGDSTESLLNELTWQVKEIRQERDRLAEKVRELRPLTEGLVEEFEAICNGEFGFDWADHYGPFFNKMQRFKEALERLK